MQSKFQVKFDPHKFHGDRGKVTIEYALVVNRESVKSFLVDHVVIVSLQERSRTQE